MVGGAWLARRDGGSDYVGGSCGFEGFLGCGMELIWTGDCGVNACLVNWFACHLFEGREGVVGLVAWEMQFAA